MTDINVTSIATEVVRKKSVSIRVTAVALEVVRVNTSAPSTAQPVMLLFEG